MRIPSLIIFLCTFLPASATDAVLADTAFAEPTANLKLHYRIALHNTRHPAAELRWNIADSTSYDYLRFAFDRYSRDDDWDSYVICEQGRSDSGQRHRSEHSRFRLFGDPFTHGFSVRVSSGEGGALLSAGVTSPVISLPVSVSSCSAPHFMLLGDSGTQLTSSFAHAEYTGRAVMSRFAHPDSLAAYLLASDDPFEGTWIYYDHVTRPERTTVGGRYTLATVADGAGGYDIIYLDGAGDPREAWQPLRIKGRLYPATFTGIFDLEWIQPSGVMLPAEYGCGATFADDLLTLQFPYWQATVRFRRQK